MGHQPFPFVPGMDICGVVVDPNGSTTFQNGNVIVASNGMNPVGGMAEYMVVEHDECVLKPTNVSVEQAAASSSSAIAARNAVMEHVQKGDRVLVLGGSGGVGSAAIAIAKRQAHASFVATTSTQSEFCKKLGADLVIDYRTQDWWQIMEDDFENNQKFDVIIDTVGGGNFYGRAEKVAKTGKDGGTFVAVTGDDPQPDCRTTWKLLQFFAKVLARMLYTKLFTTTRRLPNYVMLLPHSVPYEGRKEVLEWIENGSLTIPIDETFPFTTQGVSQAFQKVASGHAHGKVVVKIANE